MNPTATDIIIRESVKRELTAMEEIGLFVPLRAHELAKNIRTADYVGMCANEIADVLVDIAYLESKLNNALIDIRAYSKGESA